MTGLLLRMRDMGRRWLRFLARAPRRFSRWLDPLAGTDEVRYKSSKEIALENAARSLGAEVGEYYPDDWELPDQSTTVGDDEVPPDVRAKGDADREEILLYIARIQARRSVRRRVRRRRIALLAVPALVVGAAAIAALLLAGDPRGDPPDADERALALPVHGPNGQKARALQPTLLSERLSITEQGATSTIVDSAYVSQSGKVCSLVFESIDGISRTNSTPACFAPVTLRRGLDAGCVQMAWRGAAGGRTVLLGFAHEDVERIVGRAPRGRAPLRVHLSRAWSPFKSRSDVGRVKVLMITARFVRSRGASTGGIGLGPLSPRFYGLEAQLVGGKTQLVEGSLPRQRAEGPGCRG